MMGSQNLSPPFFVCKFCVPFFHQLYASPFFSLGIDFFPPLFGPETHLTISLFPSFCFPVRCHPDTFFCRIYSQLFLCPLFCDRLNGSFHPPKTPHPALFRGLFLPPPKKVVRLLPPFFGDDNSVHPPTFKFVRRLPSGVPNRTFLHSRVRLFLPSCFPPIMWFPRQAQNHFFLVFLRRGVLNPVWTFFSSGTNFFHTLDTLCF